MLPRMIDIARAKLPGGNIGQYQIGRGMSGLVLAHLGMDVAEFVEWVCGAADDEAVVAQLCGRRSPAENRALSLRLRRITVGDVPEDLRPSFERYYGTELPQNRRVFDILEEDDTKGFGKS